MADSESWFETKYLLLLVIVALFSLLAGYLYVENKKMYQAGIHQQLNKNKKRKKENWSLD